MAEPHPVGQLPLCRGCGIVAPLEQDRCASCSRELETPRWWVAVDPQEFLWVQVRASFECRACGHRSPIDYLDVDGSVSCLSCGIEQRFENKQWWGALEHAHAVADLTGPHGEGLLPEGEISIAKLNPHAEVGVTRSQVEVERGEQSLRLVASPGAPLCEKCHGLLEVGRGTARRLSLLCRPCGIEKRYEQPKNLSQRVRALCGVLAPAHEEGRLDAVLREEGGVTALRCPTCGAALNVGDSNIATCQYCQTSSRVEARARGKSKKDIEPTPFWLLFEGPSAQRGKLRNRAEAELNRERKENQRAAQQRAEARAMDRPREGRQRKEKWSRAHTLAVAGTLAVSAIFGGIVFAVDNDLKQKNALAQIEAGKQVEQQRLESERAASNLNIANSPPANPGKPFTVDLTMAVVKAEGQPLKPGATCVVYATGFDDSVKELHVTCGSITLYDSTLQVFGMRMLDQEVFRSDSNESEAAGLRYTDTGQRTNGSEISLNTKLGQAVVSSQVVPVFRVELGPHNAAKPRKRPANSQR